jgi:hypothetical protein
MEERVGEMSAFEALITHIKPGVDQGVLGAPAKPLSSK